MRELSNSDLHLILNDESIYLSPFDQGESLSSFKNINLRAPLNLIDSKFKTTTLSETDIIVDLEVIRDKPNSLLKWEMKIVIPKHRATIALSNIEYHRLKSLTFQMTRNLQQSLQNQYYQ